MDMSTYVRKGTRSQNTDQLDDARDAILARYRIYSRMTYCLRVGVSMCDRAGCSVRRAYVLLSSHARS